MSESNGTKVAGLQKMQREILALLSDGKSHSAREIVAKVGTDKLANHLTIIRKVLRRTGEDISTEFMYGLTWHRWVRYIGHSE